jgi:uncharacterized protein YjbJ (UPF0337 family)
MKPILWILIGVGAGIAAFVILNQPGPQYATGNDDIEDAADDAALWGSKQRLAGRGRNVVGKFKEGVGRITGSDELAGEGVTDQVVGGMRDVAGRVGQAVGETIHELNR